MSEHKTPFCNSCGGLVSPLENSVHFICPACGGLTLWRCEKCREFANPYTCAGCNFKGP
ncbi:MAG: zinc finger domain-containing protein [Promethearchaeota archaeon]